MNPKTENAVVSLKVEVREWVGRHFDEWAVLDLYCGRGVMYEHVWHRAPVYFGVDKFRPHALAPTAKMAAMRAAQFLRLDDYNLYDVDCYDSPWEVARRIIIRRGPGKFGLVLTSGESRGMKNGESNEAIRVTLGLSSLSDLRLLFRYRTLVWGLMVRSLIEIEGITLVDGLSAQTRGNQKSGDRVGYWGLVLDKKGMV